MAQYQPGVCNIGAEQRRARRLLAIGSFGMALAIVLAVALGTFPRSVLPATAPFIFGGWVGVLQDRFRFCVAFGALARYDLSGSGGTTGSVTEREAVAADRRRAAMILAIGAVCTIVTTALVVVLVGLI